MLTGAVDLDSASWWQITSQKTRTSCNNRFNFVSNRANPTFEICAMKMVYYIQPTTPATVHDSAYNIHLYHVPFSGKSLLEKPTANSNSPSLGKTQFCRLTSQ